MPAGRSVRRCGPNPISPRQRPLFGSGASRPCEEPCPRRSPTCASRRPRRSVSWKPGKPRPISSTSCSRRGCLLKSKTCSCSASPASRRRRSRSPCSSDACAGGVARSGPPRRRSRSSAGAATAGRCWWRPRTRLRTRRCAPPRSRPSCSSPNRPRPVAWPNSTAASPSLSCAASSCRPLAATRHPLARDYLGLVSRTETDPQLREIAGLLRAGLKRERERRRDAGDGRQRSVPELLADLERAPGFTRQVDDVELRADPVHAPMIAVVLRRLPLRDDERRLEDHARLAQTRARVLCLDGIDCHAGE